MGKHIKISVIIPVYNTENYLEECLDSVKEQTLKDLEIICINDGSTDNCASILNKYALQDSRIIIKTQKNNGLGASRNEGLKLATGKYIYFLDSDDLIEKSALEVLSQYADQKQLDVLYFDARSKFESLELSQKKSNYTTYYQRKYDYSEVRTGQKLFADMMNHGEYRASACLALYGKDFLQQNQIKFPLGIIHEDNFFTFQCMLHAQKSAHINKTFYTRRVRDSSIMTVPESVKNLKGYLDSFLLMLRETENFSFDPIVEKCIGTLLEQIWNQAERLSKQLSCEEAEKLMRTENTYRRIIYSHFLKGKLKYFPQCIADFPRYPAVSVIMPVYNAERYLWEAIESVLNQSFQNLELICIDDGSTDRSAQILEDYAHRDDRLRIISQQNLSAGAAWNAGIAAARGEYLLFVDADDFIDKNFIRQAYTSAVELHADIVLSPINAYDNITHEITPRYRTPRELLSPKKTFSYKDLPQDFFQIFLPGPSGKFCRKKLITENKLFFPQNRRHSEDICFIFPLLSIAQNIAFVESNDAPYYYRINTGTSLENSNDQTSLEFYQSYLETKVFLQKHGIYEDLKISFSNAMLSTTIYNMATQNSYESYKVVCDRFLQDGLKDFELVHRERSWFRKEWLYREYANLVNCPSEAHYQRLHRPSTAIKRKFSSVSAPIVSAILPVFNVERYIEDCVDSLQSQTVSDFEMIFVDDGSTDHTAQILERYQKDDQRIRVIYQKNCFAGIARNNGMKHARGKYLLFLDGDDFFDPQLIEYSYRKIEKENADICIFGARAFLNDVKKFSPLPWLVKASECPQSAIFSANDIAQKIFQITTPAPWNKIFRKSYVEENNLMFQSTRSANDLFFVFYALALADKITLCDKCLVNYRRNIKTSLQATQEKDPLAFCRALIQLKEALFDFDKQEQFRQSFINLCITSCIYNLKNLIHDKNAYMYVYNYFHNEGFISLGCSSKEKRYYYENNEQNYKMITDMTFESYAIAHNLFEYKQSTIKNNKTIAITTAQKKEQNNIMQQELNAVYSSMSYRIGRTITFIPRKIRGGIRCCREHGIIYTARLTTKKTRLLFAQCYHSIFSRFCKAGKGI